MQKKQKWVFTAFSADAGDTQKQVREIQRLQDHADDQAAVLKSLEDELHDLRYIPDHGLHAEESWAAALQMPRPCWKMMFFSCKLYIMCQSCFADLMEKTLAVFQCNLAIAQQLDFKVYVCNTSTVHLFLSVGCRPQQSPSR